MIHKTVQTTESGNKAEMLFVFILIFLKARVNNSRDVKINEFSWSSGGYTFLQLF